MQDEASKTLQISPSSSSEGISIKYLYTTFDSFFSYFCIFFENYTCMEMYSVKDNNGTTVFLEIFKMLYVVIYLDAE